MSNLEIHLPARDRVELRPYDDPPLGSGEVRGRTLASIDSPGSVLAILRGAMPETFPAHPWHVLPPQEAGARDRPRHAGAAQSVASWREMIDVEKRRRTDPTYQYQTPLPPTAHPAVLREEDVPSRKGQRANMESSIGELAPVGQ